MAKRPISRLPSPMPMPMPHEAKHNSLENLESREALTSRDLQDLHYAALSLQQHPRDKDNDATESPERDAQDEGSASPSESDSSDSSDGDGSDGQTDIRLNGAAWSTRSTIRTKGLCVGPTMGRYETEQKNCSDRIRRNWKGGTAASVKEIVGEQYFEEHVPRKVYQRLAALSDRTRGSLSYGRALLEDVLADRGRTGTILKKSDVHAAHKILNKEERRAEKEAEKEVKRAREKELLEAKERRAKKLAKRKQRRVEN